MRANGNVWVSSLDEHDKRLHLKGHTEPVDWFSHMQPFFISLPPYLLLSMCHRGPSNPPLTDLLEPRLEERGNRGGHRQMHTRIILHSTWLLNSVTGNREQPVQGPAWLSLPVLYTDTLKG